MTDPGSTLASRLRWLVDTLYDGSVNKAARSIGIPQKSLDNAVRGKVRQPGVRLLRGIVEHHASLGMTLDWLADGRGPAPRLPRIPEAWRAANQTGAYAVAWGELVASVELPEAVAEALHGLPYMVGAAAHAWGIIPASGDAPIAFYLAQTQALQSWSTLLEGWIRQAGAATVRQTLTRRGVKFPPRTEVKTTAEKLGAPGALTRSRRTRKEQ